MKLLAFTITTIIFSVIMATGAVVYGQTATPTTIISPTTSASPTATSTPTPTGEVEGATIPSGAPATGRG